MFDLAAEEKGATSQTLKDGILVKRKKLIY